MTLDDINNVMSRIESGRGIGAHGMRLDMHHARNLVKMIRELEIAVVDLLNGVNERHPEKEHNKWTCPDMEKLAELVDYGYRPDCRDIDKSDMSSMFSSGLGRQD